MSDLSLSPMGLLAQQTALEGVKIFPFNPKNKKPYPGFDAWESRATTNLQQIKEWWITYPEAMIAAPTGDINGFFVFDVDAGNGKVGMESLRILEEKYGLLPPTMTVRTPSGGLHFYFKMAQGIDIRNSVSELAEHIDIRGNGGCIIWPGSVRADGKYELITDWRSQ